MRRAHYLETNKQGQLPVRLVFFDCETKGEVIPDDPNFENHKLWFGYASYCRRKANNEWARPTWYRFTEQAQFWDWIERHAPGKTALYIMAHNVGFDMSAVEGFSQLYNRGWRPSRMPILDDPPTFIKYKKWYCQKCSCQYGDRQDSETPCEFCNHKVQHHDGRTINIMDTLNFFRIPLAVLGESIGLDKLTMPTYSDTQSEWDTYCKRDVEVIMKVMLEWLKFVKSENLGNFAKTLPGQALSAFRHRFMGEHRIFIDANEEALELARSSFHGGRTECFFIGKIPERVYCLDINSQYPTVMRDEEFPTRLVTVAKTITIEELKSIIEIRSVVAKVILDTERPIYAIKPDQRLIFPVGIFEASLTTPELKIAFEENDVIEVLEVAIYDQAPIFRDYINYFYARRLAAKADGNEAGSYMHKLLMNSLYGKFGQSGRVFEDIGESDSHDAKVWSVWDAEEQRNRRFRQFFGVIQEESKEAEGRNSHPAIAAHVTAFGRVLLWNLINQAGRENVFYSDTDSLFVNADGLDRLKHRINNDDLGALKIEWESDAVHIKDNKDYVIDGNAKTKGVRKDAFRLWWIGEVKAETFIDIRDFNFDRYRQTRFQSLNGKFQTGNLDQNVIGQIIKVYARQYKKGRVDDNGQVRPFKVEIGAGNGTSN